MKHEHAMCGANDIKQKRLLRGNPAQKEKKSVMQPYYSIVLPTFN
jgi:hypothetical protein